jgi:hypothetical protein
VRARRGGKRRQFQDLVRRLLKKKRRRRRRRQRRRRRRREKRPDKSGNEAQKRLGEGLIYRSVFALPFLAFGFCLALSCLTTRTEHHTSSIIIRPSTDSRQRAVLAGPDAIPRSAAQVTNRSNNNSACQLSPSIVHHPHPRHRQWSVASGPAPTGKGKIPKRPRALPESGRAVDLAAGPAISNMEETWPAVQALTVLHMPFLVSGGVPSNYCSCSTLNGQWVEHSMLNAQCSMLNAQCPTLNFSCALRNVLPPDSDTVLRIVDPFACLRFVISPPGRWRHTLSGERMSLHCLHAKNTCQSPWSESQHPAPGQLGPKRP